MHANNPSNRWQNTPGNRHTSRTGRPIEHTEGSDRLQRALDRIARRSRRAPSHSLSAGSTTTSVLETTPSASKLPEEPVETIFHPEFEHGLEPLCEAGWPAPETETLLFCCAASTHNRTLLTTARFDDGFLNVTQRLLSPAEANAFRATLGADAVVCWDDTTRSIGFSDHHAEKNPDELLSFERNSLGLERDGVLGSLGGTRALLVVAETESFGDTLDSAFESARTDLLTLVAWSQRDGMS